MGVPVITLLGHRTGPRMTASMITALGRQEWIADSEDNYIKKALVTARDKDARRAVRTSQRDRMRKSPLCDVENLAHELEVSFQAMLSRASAQGSHVAAPF